MEGFNGALESGRRRIFVLMTTCGLRTIEMALRVDCFDQLLVGLGKYSRSPKH